MSIVCLIDIVADIHAHVSVVNEIEIVCLIDIVDDIHAHVSVVKEIEIVYLKYKYRLCCISY